MVLAGFRGANEVDVEAAAELTKSQSEYEEEKPLFDEIFKDLEESKKGLSLESSNETRVIFTLDEDSDNDDMDENEKDNVMIYSSNRKFPEQPRQRCLTAAVITFIISLSVFSLVGFFHLHATYHGEHHMRGGGRRHKGVTANDFMQWLHFGRPHAVRHSRPQQAKGKPPCATHTNDKGSKFQGFRFKNYHGLPPCEPIPAADISKVDNENTKKVDQSTIYFSKWFIQENPGELTDDVQDEDENQDRSWSLPAVPERNVQKDPSSKSRFIESYHPNVPPFQRLPARYPKRYDRKERKPRKPRRHGKKKHRRPKERRHPRKRPGPEPNQKGRHGQYRPGKHHRHGDHHQHRHPHPRHHQELHDEQDSGESYDLDQPEFHRHHHGRPPPHHHRRPPPHHHRHHPHHHPDRELYEEPDWDEDYDLDHDKFTDDEESYSNESADDSQEQIDDKREMDSEEPELNEDHDHQHPHHERPPTPPEQIMQDTMKERLDLCLMTYLPKSDPNTKQTYDKWNLFTPADDDQKPPATTYFYYQSKQDVVSDYQIPRKLSVVPSIDSTKKTALIIHGMLASGQDNWVKEMSNKLIEKGNQVIVADWSGIADDEPELHRVKRIDLDDMEEGAEASPEDIANEIDNAKARNKRELFEKDIQKKINTESRPPKLENIDIRQDGVKKKTEMMWRDHDVEPNYQTMPSTFNSVSSTRQQTIPAFTKSPVSKAPISVRLIPGLPIARPPSYDTVEQILDDIEDNVNDIMNNIKPPHHDHHGHHGPHHDHLHCKHHHHPTKSMNAGEILRLRSEHAANDIAQLFERVVTSKTNTLIENTHCIGDGIGAHICGLVSQRLMKTSVKKFGRITGLDPTGPTFNSGESLSKNDAKFVDIIHTNGGASKIRDIQTKGCLFGMTQSIGHVDFYPNGGEKQPACALQSDWSGCDQSIAKDYFINSISSGDHFKAMRLDNDRNIDQKVTNTMGYHVNQEVTGDFTLLTNAKPPYYI